MNKLRLLSNHLHSFNSASLGVIDRFVSWSVRQALSFAFLSSFWLLLILPSSTQHIFTQPTSIHPLHSALLSRPIHASASHAHRLARHPSSPTTRIWRTQRVTSAYETCHYCTTHPQTIIAMAEEQSTTAAAEAQTVGHWRRASK